MQITLLEPVYITLLKERINIILEPLPNDNLTQSPLLGHTDADYRASHPPIWALLHWG